MIAALHSALLAALALGFPPDRSESLPPIQRGPRTAAAQDTQAMPSVLRDVGIDQHLDEQVPLDLVFFDEKGNEVRLGDCFSQDKPVVLVLAYFRCPMLCTVILDHLTTSLQKVSFDIGREYEVLTVSFDPRESKELANRKKSQCVQQYGRPGAAEGWHFLTGTAASIERLTKAVGYRYVYDSRTQQFIHPAGIVILTPDGKLSRYFYGVDYPPRDLRLGLVEASQRKIGSLADEVRLFCFHYDPDTGKYTASVLNYMRLFGAVIVLLLGSIFGTVWLRTWRRSRRPAQTAE